MDLIGQKFGRLKVLKRVENNKWGHICWLCQCDCSDKKKIIVSSNNLRRDHTKSCGCLQKEKVTKHGYCKTGFYRSWRDMIQRCTNPHHKYWGDYGGRGIKVCKRWMEFENFLKDMLEGWKSGLTLERIDNELGYYKDNCEWIISGRQVRNRRNSCYEEYNGENRLFVELCEEYNMPRGIVYDRFYRLDWTLKEALIIPIGSRRKQP